ncbi:MAG: nucleic acid-binding protein [Isosphaerales bacterium]
MRLVVLDTGTLGLLTNPRAQPDTLACRQWAQALLAMGVRIVVPAIADYELRRELIRAGKTSGLRRLDAVRAGFEFNPMTQTALDKAAELWAAVRNAGLTTAHPAALDGDAILAAQTIMVADAGDIVTIATNNARHLSRFPMIDARLWQSITS